jgi:ubiquinone/menaquinone biosynthesis C-methylase UbiE
MHVMFGRRQPKRVRDQEEIAALKSQLAALKSQLSELDRKWNADLVALSLKMRERIASQFQRIALKQTRQPRSHVKRDVNADLAQLERKFPNVFPVWKELFDKARIEYEERPLTSLSVEGNAGAEQFRMYLSTEIIGHVLDVGCGPLELPRYLVGQNVDRVAGVDPLPGLAKRDFEFCQGFAEFLPWPDEEFDAVVIGTSLDHVLSIDITFSEILRVLRPGGTCAIWVCFVAGAPPYDPNAEKIVALDAFHTFHFDKPWFLDIVKRYFEIDDEFAVDTQNTFYSLKKPASK